jgi:hypothetical protein
MNKINQGQKVNHKHKNQGKEIEFQIRVQL